MVIFNNLSRLLARIHNVNIGLLSDSNIHRLLPATFDMGAFVFGSMLDLMTSLVTCSAMMICRRVQVSISPDINNHICGLIAPPRAMVRFDISVSVP
jgi:hypothetical protein